MTKFTRVLYSCGKTINLSRAQIYQVPRKPPLNSLIFEKLPEPRCGDRIAGIPGTPSVKPVRVCTKQDLKATYCPPPVCDCKIKTPGPTLLQRLVKNVVRLTKCLIVGSLIYYTWAEGLWSDIEHTQCNFLKFGIKAFVVGLIVNYTWSEGLWSDAFHSSCFLGKIIEKCPPEEEEIEPEDEESPLITVYDPEPCAPFIPKTDEMLHRLGLFWNKCVITLFWILLEGPNALWDFFFKPVIKTENKEKECL